MRPSLDLRAPASQRRGMAASRVLSARALCGLAAAASLSASCSSPAGSTSPDTEVPAAPTSGLDAAPTDATPGDLGVPAAVDAQAADSGPDIDRAPDLDGAVSDAMDEPQSDAPAAGPAPGAAGLPVLRTPDPQRVEAGRAAIEGGGLGDGLMPRLALRHLYIAWPGVSWLDLLGYYQDAESYWADFRARYGLHEAPWDNDGLPLGVHQVGSAEVTFDCLLCHADEVAGQVVIGAGNSRLDLQGLHDDLVALPAAVAALQDGPIPEPYKSLLASVPVPDDAAVAWPMEDRTGAAGVTDAFGLAFALAGQAWQPGAPVNTSFGFQDPAGWWAIKYKDRLYRDGAGRVGGHRTMMATLLAFGLSPLELLALDDTFEDVGDYLLSIETPVLADPGGDDGLVEQGREVFTVGCAGCHGVYDGEDAAYPGLVVAAAEVGTDPLRAERFGAPEADWANSWLADPAHPMQATGGYLAPPLSGVWAQAPFLHNGSVPDLQSLLRPDERPTRWRRTGSAAADYDVARVGWRFDVVDAPSDRSTVEGRRVVDTTIPGMSAAGHIYGADLDDGDVAALLAYLRRL